MRKYQQHLVNSCVSLQTRRFHTKLSYSENSVLPVHKKSVFNTIVPHIQIVNSVFPVHKNSVLLHKKLVFIPWMKDGQHKHFLTSKLTIKKKMDYDMKPKNSGINNLVHRLQL
jgi:hypothetical protein